MPASSWELGSDKSCPPPQNFGGELIRIYVLNICNLWNVLVCFNLNFKQSKNVLKSSDYHTFHWSKLKTKHSSPFYSSVYMDLFSGQSCLVQYGVSTWTWRRHSSIMKSRPQEDASGRPLWPDIDHFTDYE